MLRGIYKEFVTVRLKDNPLYEEAIFVLRCDNEKKTKSNTDMLFEANRILCEGGVKKPRKKRKILKKILISTVLVLLGAITGALLTFILLK